MASGKSNLTVVAIITPKPEALSNFEAKVSVLVNQVKAKEPDTLAYEVQTAKNEEKGVDFVFIERYRNKGAFKAHGETEHFKAFATSVRKEDLLAKPMVIKVMAPKAGFESRL